MTKGLGTKSATSRLETLFSVALIAVSGLVIPVIGSLVIAGIYVWVANPDRQRQKFYLAVGMTFAIIYAATAIQLAVMR